MSDSINCYLDLTNTILFGAFGFLRVCDKALPAADLAALLAFGFCITLAADVATIFDVFRFGDFRCDNALAAERFAFLLAAGRRNTFPARLAALRPVPFTDMPSSLLG